ncbi:S-adenosyl-L-methionine-dependent methyltransferase [Astrocystis sublimbata]|nr:S-adenosyl-L-methionine-dependent methyltransferase [Astrocystis sublimbata]
MSSNRATELLSSISQNVKACQDYYSSQGTSWQDNKSQKPSILPKEVEIARLTAKEACYELQNLLTTPSEVILEAGPASTRAMALDFIYTYKIGYDLNWDEKATYDDIAKKCGLDEDDTRRMLRLAMAHHLFDETDDGMVTHTSSSFLMANDTGLSAWVGLMTKENWPPMLKITEALAKYPGSQEPLESAYALAHGLVKPAFQTWEQDPQRIKRFTQGMEYVYSGVGFQPNYILEGIRLDGSAQPLFVDVGGSKGHVSIDLAQSYPHWSFIVQDSARTIAVGRQELPRSVEDRVSFQVHDFFLEQPVKNADIYFFRMIFHDWSDKYAIRILRNLIPALKKGAMVIISDACFPPKGVVSNYQEQWLRGYDIVMKCFTNGKERDREGWVSLFTKADARFKFLGVAIPPGSKEALIKAEWTPESSCEKESTTLQD